MNLINGRRIEIMLLTMAVAIFLAALTTRADDPTLPNGPNTLYNKLQGFFQASTLKPQFLATRRVDAGTQGTLTAAQIDHDNPALRKVAVIRYGNPKDQGGDFAFTSFATREIERTIRWELEAWDIDPNLPDSALSPEQRRKKREVIKEVRILTGYSIEEQRTEVLNRERALGRPLTPAELEEVRETFPLKQDVQSDELESLAVIRHADVYKLQRIFLDQNGYSKILPDYFKNTHVLTPTEVSERRDRGVRLNEGENLFYAHYQMNNEWVEYTVRNHWREVEKEVTLHTREGMLTQTVPVVTTAWELDPLFFEEEGEEEFRNVCTYVMDGYLELEPYIEVDQEGYESVSATKVLALYHTYTRADNLCPNLDFSRIDKSFRLSEARKFIEKMMREVQKLLNEESD